MPDPVTATGLRCVVVTPERQVLDETVDSVALPMYDGELGVLPGRAPLIGRLGYGELRLRRGDRVQRFYVDGGFVQVRANLVTVLTDQAKKPEDINTTEATNLLATIPTTIAATPEEQESRFREADRARAKLHVAQHRASESATA
jgi:F-type H+-transporting ATPase subunit epsilon